MPSAHLVHLVQGQAAVGLGQDGPVGHLAVRRDLAREHVVQGQVVADGVLRGRTNATQQIQR